MKPQTEPRLYFLSRESLPALIIWSKLAIHPINKGQPAPRECGNDGEYWQYMGSIGNRHTFRHRNHPATESREYIDIIYPAHP